MAFLPSNFDQAVADFLQSGLCVVLGANEGLANLLAPITTGIGGQTQANIARALRSRACGADPATPITPPFSGGQCPISYRVFFDVVDFDPSCTPNPPSDLSIVRNGPIGGLSIDDTGANPTIRCPSAQGNRVLLQHAGGPSVVFGPNARGVQSAVITSVVPEPSAPDNCGDPPTYNRGAVRCDPTEAPDITYNIDDSTEITVPISFVFSPRFLRH